ncbi:MAG: protein kinase domain-containing protein, partial [Waterburya sp.]
MNIKCKNGHQVTAISKFCHLCGEPLLIENSQPVTAILPPETPVESLKSGTDLRERYIIQRQLGQGGFARTYLAEDTGRFREKIVIKEFMPSLKNTFALKKAEELFQREAAILHQLDHPQIPRFWEIFQQEKQIFLVVDYIDGLTYKDLLKQRLDQGQCFSEEEILEFFGNLLPVLSYLHRRGVIHRDISPDNIIFRNYDRLPVLIDLGGVKQVAMEVNGLLERKQNPVTISSTCLGKVGYAPDEQIYIGLVAPHSDLYAMAVTALVLMTGKKPQQLLNPNTLDWIWEEDLKLNPLLTKTINQMLAIKPAYRFQSAEEVLQVLTPLLSKKYLDPTLICKSSEQLEILSKSSTNITNINEQDLSLERRSPFWLFGQQGNFFKQNWQAIPNSIKSLVLMLLLIA